MAKKATGSVLSGKLTEAKITSITKAGRYGDAGQLWLQVRSANSKSWLLRYTFDGKARAMGLGQYPVVGLAQARERALAARRLLADGIDPLEARDTARQRARAAEVRPVTFLELTGEFLKANAAGWRNEKHASQWRATLVQYAFPVFGDLPIADVTTELVLKAIEPIWRTKPETASRVRGRIEQVLASAKARGLRDGDNPAAWRGHLDQILPRRSKVAPVVHHSAMPWREIGSFMARLRRRDGSGARCLEFAILTASRSGEVRGATWSEVDLVAKTWTIPGARMKAGKDHRVPLSEAAAAILRALASPQPDEASFVFPSPNGRQLSDMALSAVLRRMDVAETVHGFRSCFRDWVSEATSFQAEIAEAALAHTLGGKTQVAYQRGDLLEKRRGLMDAWAQYCDGAAAADTATDELPTPTG